MAIKNKETLKNYFKKGGVVSEKHFVDLIDSSINIKDIIKFTKNENQILDYFLIMFIGFLYILIVHLFEPVGDKDIEWIKPIGLTLPFV